MGRNLAILGQIIAAAIGIGYYFFVAHPVTDKQSLLHINEGLDLQGGVHAVLQAPAGTSRKDMADTLQRIGYRVNSLGVSEPTIQQQGTLQILVDLPGVKNQQEAINTIGQTGQLIFSQKPLTFKNGKPTNPQDVVLTGRELASAQASLGTGGSQGAAIVNLTFKPAGAKAFAAATTKDAPTKAPIYIYLDNKLLQSPAVQSPITDGKAMITNYPSLQAAQRIAVLLNSGALPVPLKLVEVRTVSPTLGAQSIHDSEVAMLVAVVLIGLFMIGFYRAAGLLADLALVIYTFLLLLLLIGIHAVLTLPGVAGMVLSAGIAVDANVIIFARIKDELRMGKSFRAAIDHGFKNAFRAILDSNVSTIIAAAVLYELGTGEVRGFAVTLGLGVMASMLTAVVLTRYLLNLVTGIPALQQRRVFLG